MSDGQNSHNLAFDEVEDGIWEPLEIDAAVVSEADRMVPRGERQSQKERSNFR
jgi:hypothetical protein